MSIGDFNRCDDRMNGNESQIRNTGWQSCARDGWADRQAAGGCDNSSARTAGNDQSLVFGGLKELEQDIFTELKIFAIELGAIEKALKDEFLPTDVGQAGDTQGSTPVGGQTGDGTGANPVGGQTGDGTGSRPVGGQTGDGTGTKPVGGQAGDGTGANPVGGQTGDGSITNPVGGQTKDHPPTTAGTGDTTGGDQNLRARAQSFGAHFDSSQLHNTVNVDSSNFKDVMQHLLPNTQYRFADGSYDLSKTANLPSNVQLIADNPGKVQFNGNGRDSLLFSQGSSNIDVSGINFDGRGADVIDLNSTQNFTVENTHAQNADYFLKALQSTNQVMVNHANIDKVKDYSVFADIDTSNILFENSTAADSSNQATFRSYGNNTAIVDSTIRHHFNPHGANKNAVSLYGDAAGGNDLIIGSKIEQFASPGTDLSGQLFGTNAIIAGKLGDGGFPAGFSSLPVDQQLSYFNAHQGDIHSYQEIVDQAPQLAARLTPGQIAFGKAEDNSSSNVIIDSSSIVGGIFGGGASSKLTIEHSTVDATDSVATISASANGNASYDKVAKPGGISLSDSTFKGPSNQPIVLNGADTPVNIGPGVTFNGKPAK